MHGIFSYCTGAPVWLVPRIARARPQPDGCPYRARHGTSCGCCVRIPTLGRKRLVAAVLGGPSSAEMDDIEHQFLWSVFSVFNPAGVPLTDLKWLLVPHEWLCYMQRAGSHCVRLHRPSQQKPLRDKTLLESTDHRHVVCVYVDPDALPTTEPNDQVKSIRKGWSSLSLTLRNSRSRRTTSAACTATVCPRVAGRRIALHMLPPVSKRTKFSSGRLSLDRIHSFCLSLSLSPSLSLSLSLSLS